MARGGGNDVAVAGTWDELIAGGSLRESWRIFVEVSGLPYHARDAPENDEVVFPIIKYGISLERKLLACKNRWLSCGSSGTEEGGTTTERLRSPPPSPPVWPCCTERPLRPVGACPFNDFVTGRLGRGAATRGRPWLFSRSGAEANNYERGQTAAGGGHQCGAALTGPQARQRWPRRAASRAPGKTMTGTAEPTWRGFS